MDLLQQVVDGPWKSAYYLCKGDEFTLNVIVPLIILLTVYWTVGTFFTVIDLTGSPDAIIQFKIPDPSATKYPRAKWKQVRQVISQVVFNQTVIAIPVLIFFYLMRQWRGYDNGIELPKFPRIVFDFIVTILVEEILFYYSHRFLHWPQIYKRYHKKHHEWLSPIGISAIYCHPVEHVLSNVLPTFMGSVVSGSHVISLWLWLVFATAYGVIVHSGYHLPLTPTPEFHNYHHIKFTENFGVAGILDWLHGTDKQFRKSQAYKRNKVLFTLNPIHKNS